MQKKDTISQIRKAIEENDIDNAVGLWSDSYHFITAAEFIEACQEGGWNSHELLEILKSQRFMYEEAIAEVQTQLLNYSNGKS